MVTTTSDTIKAIFFVLTVVFVFLINFLAQTPQPLPATSPQPSPAAIPSPTPARAPSPTPLPGAQNFHQWGSITVFNGLPSDSVRTIAQTADGVMWFGTDSGLARFDGRRVQNLSPGENDASSSILSLEYDEKSDALWVGTRAGAFIYQYGRFESIPGTEKLGITTLLLRDRMYFGTDAGLVLQSSGTSAVPMFSEAILASSGTPAVITGLTLADGRLLVSASERGIFIVSEGQISKLSSPLSTAAVNAILADENRIWIGTDAPKSSSGLSLLAERSMLRVPAQTSKVLSLGLNDAGLWAGTERYGLFHFTDGKLKKNYTFENTSGGLRSNTIYTIFTDREDVLWIGTNRGVSRFDRLGASQQTVSDSPNSNFIRTLFRRDDGAILAGANRGLFASSRDTWRPVSGFDNKVIYAIAADKSDGEIIGTATGAFNSSGRLILNGDTRAFANFRSRAYAAVFGRGVVQVDTGQLIFPHDSVTAIADGTDRLWIGTAGVGLFSFDGSRVKTEIEPDIMKSGTIWKIVASSDASLWIAGQHGVFRVRDGQPERIVEIEDVRDVLVQGDEFWAATTVRGLLHGKNDARFGWVVSSVGFEQGLPSEKAFAIVRADEKFLIATNRGVVTYKPGLIAPKLIATRVLSQRVHDLAELASQIDLDYPQNSILVEVAGQSSRTFPEEFQYAFELKNSNGEVVDKKFSNDPQYNPTGLTPGAYTIETVAFDRDLNASAPLLIKFSIAKAPFPWTATALGVLLAIAVLGLVWAVVEHRRIRQRNRELAAARFDLANEAERERRRIARDLHDQTLADLRHLMMKSDKGDLDAGTLRSEIESVSTEVRRICEDLSPSVLENVGLIAALDFLLTNTFENRRFEAAESVDEQFSFPLNVQLQIYRIAQEVLTNIRRHSDAQTVAMKIAASEDNQFLLTVLDDGATFEPGVNGNGRGISNIRARANLINAKVSWKRQSSSWNKFTLRIAK